MVFLSTALLAESGFNSRCSSDISGVLTDAGRFESFGAMSPNDIATGGWERGIEGNDGRRGGVHLVKKKRALTLVKVT